MTLAGLAGVIGLVTIASASAARAQPATPSPSPRPATTAMPGQQAKLVTKPAAPPPKRPTAARSTPKESESHDPSPDVRLTLEALGPRGGWRIRIANEGQVPVRLVADARLLSLEITPRGERQPVRCELPLDMRPVDDASRALVLPPGRSYAEPVEPVMMCLGSRELRALAQGAIVVGHLGWTGRAARPPFVVAPIDGVEPGVAALKRLDSPPIRLPDEPTPPPLDARQGRPDDPDRPRLSLRGQETVDAPSPSLTLVTVTLRNDGKRPVTVRLRPETLRFHVSAANGAAERCRWPLLPVAAMPDLFTTIRPEGSESLTVGLDAYCGGHLFDQPGLFFVRPELDTRRASGAEIALPTFDGLVVSGSLTYVRLHQGVNPVPMIQPRLEPLPPP